MTPEEKYELFERKISGELSVKEEETLSLLMSEDTNAAQEFKAYEEWNSYLDSNLSSAQAQYDLENNLKEIGDTFFEQKPDKPQTKVIRMPSWGYAVAASIAIILGVYTFTKSSATYNDFVSIPALSITERSGEAELVKKAEETFNSQNYTDAEQYLFKLLENDNANSTYLFYYGITLVEQNKYEQASQAFSKLQLGNSGYKYKAIWFEALNQLKQNNKERCIEILKTLPEEAEDYQQAQKLMKKL
ncbi:tetratricopeptide repeat protein [Aquimarina sp. 2201CG14-23]|uniref:tetratricopeptide repeat protein n=1 Tax=Aquimarina mycalae TaxID=3040073 RepID=UPI002477D43B|nr:hypothetical protein [Aquimarina sp. 2201CG14-23]MDH7445457.1 hypothetical protein [Aquimarina sp. 2201CG14-23]